MNKKNLCKICTTLMVFVVMLGAGLFYLRYEGVIRYQYVLDESPNLRLTVEDAVQIIRPQNLDYATEYNLDHVLVYEPKIPVAVVKIIFSELPEPRMNAKVSFIPRGKESEGMIVRLQDNEPQSKEILFTFPQVESDEIRLTVHDIADVERIEMYENSAYVDQSKEVPHKLNAFIAILLAAMLAAVYLVADVEWRSGKGLAFPVLYFILEIAVLSFCLNTRKYEVYSQGFEIFIYGVFTIVTVVLCATYRMLFIWHSPLHWVFAIGGITMGIIMMLLIQPYTVPDESTHFYQAYKASNRMMGMDSEYEKVIRWDDVRFLEKQQVFGTANTYERYIALAEDFGLVGESKEMKRFNTRSIESVPLGYVVTGAAITLGRMINLSGVMLFYLGRFLNLLLFVGLITLSIYLLPFGKAAVMCISMAPVSMELAASYSYDPVVTAFAFLYVSYVLRLWAQEEAISLKQFALCCVLGILLAPSKISYAPMTATVFLIPAKKYAFGGNKKWLLNFCVVLVAFIALFATQAGSIMRVSQTGQISWADGAASYSLKYLLVNIRETVNLYLHTFERGIDYYFTYLFSSQLGVLNLNSYDWVTVVFFILFFVGCQRADNEPQVCCTLYLRWGVIVVAMGTVVITMLSMLLCFTPMGSYSILGVQGRYFIPMMVILIPMFRNMQIQVQKETICWCSFIALWASLFACTGLLQNIPRLLIFA